MLCLDLLMEVMIGGGAYDEERYEMMRYMRMDRANIPRQLKKKQFLIPIDSAKETEDLYFGFMYLLEIAGIRGLDGLAVFERAVLELTPVVRRCEAMMR